MTDIGIIGAGLLGQAMARVALRGGRSVLLANSRGPGSLTQVVSALGEGVTGWHASRRNRGSDRRDRRSMGSAARSGQRPSVELFQDAGFAVIDLGDQATGAAMQQVHHPLAGVNLIQV